MESVGGLTDAESRVLDALDDQALVEDLVDLIRIPSVTGTDAESELQHRQAAALRELGMDVDAWRIDVDAIREHPDFPGDETDRTEGYGVVATMPGENDGIPALVLQGHVDVVPIGDPEKWVHDPFSAWIDGDVLHGRGACDMKAGVAVNFAVARALHASGVTLARPFAVHTVVSEEDGGLGAFATLQRGHRGDVAVITEPTSGTLITANAGALTFEVRTPGTRRARQHPARGRERVRRVPAAQRGASRRSRRIATATPTRCSATTRCRIRSRSAGSARATGRAACPTCSWPKVDWVCQLGEEPAAARAEFEAAIAAACSRDPWLRDHPAEVSWTGGQFASGRIHADHALIGEVADAVTDVTGARPIEAAAPYGSDLRLYSGLGGIPTLHYGPGDVRFAHAPREQVSISETLDVARTLLVLALRRCGVR